MRRSERNTAFSNTLGTINMQYEDLLEIVGVWQAWRVRHSVDAPVARELAFFVHVTQGCLIVSGWQRADQTLRVTNWRAHAARDEGRSDEFLADEDFALDLKITVNSLFMQVVAHNNTVPDSDGSVGRIDN